MRIGIVCYPTYGGSGIVATELGMHLAKNQHQVHFISYGIPARLDVTMPNIIFHQVNIENYPLFQYQPYSLALSTLIVNIAENYGLDVLHVHYAIPHAYAAYIAKQILKERNIDLKVITTLHGTDITLVGKHPVYQSAVEFSINQSDVVTSVSESLKKDTLAIFNIKKEIIVIPNFIENKIFQKTTPCIRANFAKEEERILIHVSNLRPVKRVQDVIEIFRMVQETIPSKLLIVGEGPEWESAERLVQHYGLVNKVRFMGKVRDLPHILCVSDLFLLPSEQESFGLAALEAMAASVPVISSNAGGVPEVNIHGTTGYICATKDINCMAKHAIELLGNEQQLNQFKQQAKQQALRFEMDKILPLYQEIYDAQLK